jgi:hypothetical protein
MRRCTVAQFYELIDIIPTWKPILLIGDTGIGKTTIVRNYSKSKDRYFAYVPCMSTAETVNLTGIPDVSGTHTTYKPMEWYRPDTATDLLLDEINRNEYIINALMELAVDQHIGSAQLAPGSRVFAAMNPSSTNQYMVKELELSHMSRFCVVELAPTADEWLMFAEQEGCHPVILAFIRKYKEALDPDEDGSKRKSRQYYQNLDSTRRGWSTLSEPLFNGEKEDAFNPFKGKDGKVLLELLVTGYVGPTYVESFCKMYYSMMYKADSAKNDEPLTATDIMEGTTERWKEELPGKVKKLCLENSIEAAELVSSFAKYVAKQANVLYNETTNKITARGLAYSINFYKFLHSCTPELVSQMYFNHIKPVKVGAGDNAVTWADIMCAGCPEIPKLLQANRTNSGQSRLANG